MVEKNYSRRWVQVVLDLLVVVVAFTASAAAKVDLVNPFIGTDGEGRCIPGATCPNALVNAGPDTGNWDAPHCSGYVSGERTVYGFSQTHVSGVAYSWVDRDCSFALHFNRPWTSVRELPRENGNS